MRNTNDGVSLVQTAEGTLNEIGSILTVCVNSQFKHPTGPTPQATGISSTRILLMKNQIPNCFNSTFNGISLLAGKDTGAITIQVGIDNIGGDIKHPNIIIQHLKVLWQYQHLVLVLLRVHWQQLHRLTRD